MLFGEIVEPTTRALIDDEFEEYPEYRRPSLEWEGNFSTPSQITTLIFIENNKILKLFQATTLNSAEIVCSLKDKSLKIYKTCRDQFIISYTKSDLATGVIVESLVDWLQKATKIYAITSESTSTYQNVNSSEKAEAFIRKLSVNDNDFNYKKLEAPNLVSGLGGDILSYCIHTGLKCSLFVVYLDNSPLDSINTNPIIQLMKSLGLSLTQTHLNLSESSSNLYL